MRSRKVVAWAPFAAAALLVGQPGARAGNGTHPRTPVLWEKEGTLEPPACLTVVDRSQDPVLHLPYAIPYEDTEVTPDEVEDSRTHQFLAFCRAFDAQHEPPLWLSEADVAKAAAKGLAPPEPLGPEDVLDTNPELAGCSTRITADDARRPITFEMAAMGVDWDTTGLAPGPWTVYGYTWEPVANLWSLRPGVVLVTDGPQATVPPPAAAVMPAPGTEPYYAVGDTARFSLCAAAGPGSTAQLEWAEAAEVPVYEPWGAPMDLPAGEATVELSAPVPAAMAGKSVLVRVTVTDGEDRLYRAHLTEVAIVFAGDGTTGGTGGSAGPGDGTDTGGTSVAAGTVGPGGGGGTTGGGASGDGAGCTCAAERDPLRAPAAAMPALVALVGGRRRRRWPGARARTGEAAADPALADSRGHRRRPKGGIGRIRGARGPLCRG